ncbi:hypothetical protein ZWY2020_036242, partial [Hordeum vulgare]
AAVSLVLLVLRALGTTGTVGGALGTVGAVGGTLEDAGGGEGAAGSCRRSRKIRRCQLTGHVRRYHGSTRFPTVCFTNTSTRIQERTGDRSKLRPQWSRQKVYSHTNTSPCTSNADGDAPHLTSKDTRPTARYARQSVGAFEDPKPHTPGRDPVWTHGGYGLP